MTKKTKPSIKLGFMNTLSIFIAVFLFALLLKNSSLSASEVSRALKVCVEMLIPSLFPLSVASEIVTNTGAIEKITSKFSAPIAKILGVNKSATPPYFLGLFGGYTASSKSAVLLYQSGKISKGDCESIIALSGVPSLAFFTGFIGVGVFKNSIIGWKFWLISLLSTLILGMINKVFFNQNSPKINSKIRTKNQQKSLPKIVVDAISHSAHTMLIICACVVFFSVLISVLKLYLDRTSLPESIKNIALGTLEITKGISSSLEIKNLNLRAAFCSFLVGWSGLCVHFQVIALCEDTDISFKKYFLFKALQSVICTLLALIVFNFKF